MWKCHHPFLALHGHVHHTGSRGFKHQALIPEPSKFTSPVTAGKAEGQDATGRGGREGVVSRGIMSVVAGLRGGLKSRQGKGSSSQTNR